MIKGFSPLRKLFAADGASSGPVTQPFRVFLKEAELAPRVEETLRNLKTSQEMILTPGVDESDKTKNYELTLREKTKEPPSGVGSFVLPGDAAATVVKYAGQGYPVSARASQGATASSDRVEIHYRVRKDKETVSF